METQTKQTIYEMAFKTMAKKRTMNYKSNINTALADNKTLR